MPEEMSVARTVSGLACEHLRVETGTAAELHQASQIAFAVDALPHHRSRPPSDLQLDDAIVPLCDLRPELGLLAPRVLRFGHPVPLVGHFARLCEWWPPSAIRGLY